MSRYSRREVLGLSAIGLAGLSGCMGDNDSSASDTGGANNNIANENTERPDRDDDGIPDSRDDYPNDPSLSQKRTQSDTRNIEEDEWRYYELSFDSTGYIRYDFIVRDGPAIDVIFIDESEYSHFDEGERYEYKPDLSALDSTGEEVSSKIPEGSYRLIFDNSSRGEATPPTNFSNDVVSVEFDLEIGE